MENKGRQAFPWLVQDPPQPQRDIAILAACAKLFVVHGTIWGDAVLHRMAVPAEFIVECLHECAFNELTWRERLNRAQLAS